MMELTTKTALVTGASRGIGRAVAGRLAAEGALVGVHYGTNDDAANETLAAIDAAGGEAFLLNADLGVDDAIDRLFDDLDAALDGKALDVLVNNAGVLDPTPFDQVTPAAFDHSCAVNVRAPFFITQRAVARMRNGGRIINLSSAVTRIASPFTHYAMNKAAIEVFGRTLANALGPHQITVNTVTPGVVGHRHGSLVGRRTWDQAGSDLDDRDGPRRAPAGCRRRRDLPGFRCRALDHGSKHRGQRRAVARTARQLSHAATGSLQ
jgi:3-oxoacyl-[acyl-carrier protein] reductase